MSSFKTKILIVEDVKIAQKVAALTLLQLNCEVDTADTGTQALEMVNHTNYALIFMDLGLPDMDGLTITENIRGQACYAPWGKEVPIVALTAHSNDMQLKQECFDAGINDFIVKPLTSEFARQILVKYCRPATEEL